MLYHWFDYQEGTIESVVRTIADKDKEVQKRNLRLHRILGEEPLIGSRMFRRSREQIGLMLSMAAIKFSIGDDGGYEEEVP